MGSMIVREVIELLSREGIPAEESCPGRKYPQISRPVAAVSVYKADAEQREVVLQIHVVCPAAMGTGACGAEARRVCELLRSLGGRCVQNAYRYDGMARLTQVEILAAFTGRDSGESWIPGPGFRVWVDDEPMPWAVSLQTEKVTQAQPLYVIGESVPADIPEGSRIWNIRLEEHYPAEIQEGKTHTGPFRLRVDREDVSSTLEGCRWTGVSRTFSREGLRRVLIGMALGREED